MALWGNNDSKTASGTVSIASTGVVTGSSTAFTTQAKIGNTIKTSAGVEYQIVTITSDTVAKVIMGTNNGNGTVTTASGLSYTLSEKPASVAHESADSGVGVHGDSSKVFGVDTTEESAGGDNVTEVAIIQGGTNYLEVPTVSFSGGGGSSAAATATIAGGSVTKITVTNTGTAYTSAPAVSLWVPRRTIPTSGITTATDNVTYAGHLIEAGDAIRYYNGGGTSATGLTTATTYYAGQVGANAFKVYNTRARGTTAVSDKTVATTAVDATADTITIATHGYVTGAEVNYNNQGGASIGNLTSGNDYFVIVVDASTIKLATTSANATAGTAINISSTGNNAQTFASTGRVDISGTGNNAQYFDLTDDTTATATAALGSGAGGTHVTHAGWVRRTVGTGGRAGRVQYETLVAAGSITGDQADDIQFPDA